MNMDEWKDSYLRLSENSGNSPLFEDVLSEIKEQMHDRKVSLTQSQILGIASHISGMIQRSRQGKIMKVDNKDIFSDVSKDSLELAAQVCQMIRNISEDEKYLLSIHFENAKSEQVKGEN